MANKPTPAPKSKATLVNETVIAQDFAAVNQLATLQATANENVVALAQQLGYDGSVSVGALEDGIRFYQERSAEACIELGKRLVLLKEACLHGEFLPRLESLGIDARAAQRFMSVSLKFSKASTLTLLKAANSRAKLLELMVLDDEEVAELSDGGTVRGMAADDISSMGVRELRASLREARAEKVADDKILADKNAKIDKLSRYIKKSTPDQVLADLQKEATALMNDALGCVRGQIRHAFIAIKNHTEDDHSVWMAGLLGQLQADITALREEFSLPDVSNAADQALASEVAQWAEPTKSAKK